MPLVLERRRAREVLGADYAADVEDGLCIRPALFDRGGELVWCGEIGEQHAEERFALQQLYESREDLIA